MAGSVPILIDQVRSLPNKEGYTTVVVKQGYVEKMFNGAAGMVTRKIRISGVKLVWDEYGIAPSGTDAEEVSKNLYSYSGSNDIESLEMYADEIVIRSVLKFPQTDVWICTRKLVFERDGCIVTTPLPYYTPARSTTHDDRGRPVNAMGQFVAKDGLKGATGGSITLCLPEGGRVTVPVPLDTSPRRFVTVGGKGQDAERGGYLDYVAKPGQTGVPGDEVFWAGCGPQNVEDLLYPSTSDWRFPANWKAEMEKRRVVYVHLDLFNDTALTAIGNPKAAHTTDSMGAQQWPGGVPDAFPSGKGGDGGDGGLFRTFWALGGLVSADAPNDMPQSYRLVWDSRGGEPGSSQETGGRVCRIGRPIRPRPPRSCKWSWFVSRRLGNPRVIPRWTSPRAPFRSSQARGRFPAG